MCHGGDTGKLSDMNVTLHTGIDYTVLFDNRFVLTLGRQQDLFRVLKAYTLYRPEEGYCQAQAPIAAVLLMHMPAEVCLPSTTNTL